MFRAILELLFTILIVIVARALLTGVFRGIARSSSNAFQSRPENTGKTTDTSPSGPQLGGELHKDPVCGTYVAESTPFRRQISGQTFYYCSSDCREKHALVTH